MLAGEAAPTGRARRGAKPPVFPLAAIDDPALLEVLAELAAARADEMDADTVNRELSIARKAIGWWQRQGWINCDPTIDIERRPAPPARTFVDLGFVVLDHAELTVPLSDLDTSVLTQGEWREVRFYGITTLGGVLFNAWG
jgi:hypothetical protein